VGSRSNCGNPAAPAIQEKARAMNWVKLTNAHNGEPVWVNLDRICEMSEGNFTKGGEISTRLLSGDMVSHADGGMEFYSIEVRQRPDQIIEYANKR
jgi:hypothetical protein